MPTKIAYAAKATATGGGRNGHAKTEDGSLDLTMAVPKEMGGSGTGNNPEQLFATGYAACFLGAMRFVASQGKHVAVPDDASVSATVGIGPREDKGFGLAVTLDITLPGVDRAEAEALVAEADTICPYSHAVRGNVDVTLNVL